MGADQTSYAPTDKGFKDSNYANVVERYELAPYIYTLAWRAYLAGDPVVPPLVYHFQDDPKARSLGNVKMLGDSLLFGIVAQYGQTERAVYLPPGRWINYHTHDWFDSNGAETPPFPVYLDRYGLKGAFTLPLFARAGAIIPKMFVDRDTQNIGGKRAGGDRRDDLVVRVYSDPKPSTRVLYEDDGETLAYTHGSFRTTRISQELQGTRAVVTIGPAQGSYDKAPAARAKVLELVVRDAAASGVRANGASLPPCASSDAFTSGSSGPCFLNAGHNLILARTGANEPVARATTFAVSLGPAPPTASAQFTCDNGQTEGGEAIYVIGDPAGGWDPARAVRLNPSRYPRWTGLIQGLPAGQSLAWKCFKMRDGAAGGTFGGGDNLTLTTPAAGGFAGTTSGSL
jgi:alpha-glucosidase